MCTVLKIALSNNSEEKLGAQKMHNFFQQIFFFFFVQKMHPLCFVKREMTLYFHDNTITSIRGIITNIRHMLSHVLFHGKEGNAISLVSIVNRSVFTRHCHLFGAPKPLIFAASCKKRTAILIYVTMHQSGLHRNANKLIFD